MSRRGRGARKPWVLLRGKKILDDIDGSEHYEFDGNMRKQRGLNVHKQNYDTLLDTERQEQINKRRR